MTSVTLDALHDIHTATNDVLKGYREMRTRAEPEIEQTIQRLTSLHERHAAEQRVELQRLHDDGGSSDTSFQGTLNKAVVILRDWLSNLDADVLPKVREGEEAILEEYQKAVQQCEPGKDAQVLALLRRQMLEVDHEVARLPKD